MTKQTSAGLLIGSAGASASFYSIREHYLTSLLVICGDSPVDASLPSLDARILKNVRKLGRRPRELHNKHRGLTDEGVFERRLADRIRKAHRKLLPHTREYLGSLSCVPSLDVGILRDVRKLGRLPQEVRNPRTKEGKAKRKLAAWIRRANSKLLPQTREYLISFSTSSEDHPAKRQCIHPALEGSLRLDAGILDDVRMLGRIPRELRNKHRDLTDEEHVSAC